MIIRMTLSEDDKPTPEQIAQIQEAKKYPIVFDEDCPELTPEMYEAFRRKERVRMAQRQLAQL